MNKLIPVFLIGILMLGSTPAFAHTLLTVSPDNITDQKAFFIPDHKKKSFTLETMNIEGESHWYWFSGQQGERLQVKVLVPDLARFDMFNPSFDLIYGNEKIIVPLVAIPQVEQHTGTLWKITAQQDIILPETTTYFIRVHDELFHYQIGDVGKFSLEIGFIDQWTLWDILIFPIELFNIYYFVEDYLTLTIWMIGIAILILVIIYLIKNRNKK